MKALARACLLALAAAGCAAGETDGAASAGATAGPGLSAPDAEARRDSRDSRPGSREMEEAN